MIAWRVRDTNVLGQMNFDLLASQECLCNTFQGRSCHRRFVFGKQHQYSLPVLLQFAVLCHRTAQILGASQFCMTSTRLLAGLFVFVVTFCADFAATWILPLVACAY